MDERSVKISAGNTKDCGLFKRARRERKRERRGGVEKIKETKMGGGGCPVGGDNESVREESLKERGWPPPPPPFFLSFFQRQALGWDPGSCQPD